MDSSSEDKEWATKYLLDPLTAPEPSQETGPGSHFTKTTSTVKSPALAKSSNSSPTSAYPTPPTSASPTRSSFHPSNPYSPSHRQVAFGEYPKAGPTSPGKDPVTRGSGLKRESSLSQRFPGDMSHRPLDQLRREAKAADRSPHLKRNHLPGADIIDTLDNSTFGGAYHHEGPYDATLVARNINYQNSPIEAVRSTNEEALRATPREMIKDSLTKHVPLQGTAIIPSGMASFDGKVMNYEEGDDLMRDPDAPGGAYKRWEGVKYLPEDYKGKGEPSFSIEKGLKEHDKSRRIVSEGDNSYEMQPQRNRLASRHRSASGNHADLMSPGSIDRNSLRVPASNGEIRRSNTTGGRISEGLKRRFGSLRRSKKASES